MDWPIVVQLVKVNGLLLAVLGVINFYVSQPRINLIKEYVMKKEG